MMTGPVELIIALAACMFSIGLPIVGIVFLLTLYRRSSTSVPCATCGAPMRPADNFCANCGTPRASGMEREETLRQP